MAIPTRLAVPDDAYAIAVAHTRAWQVAYDGIIPAAILDGIDVDARADNWRQNIIEDALPDGTPAPENLVAEVDGAVVGFACVGVWRDDRAEPDSGEVWAIYVHPDHWGTGAGYALMNESVDLFRRQAITTGYLWVVDDNALARAFYERQGWSADAVTKDDEFGGTMITERRYSLAL